MIRFVLSLLALVALLSPDLQAAARVVEHTVTSDLSWLYYGLSFAALGTAAITTSNSMTLLDMAKLLDPNGQVARMINLLAQKNEMLQDIQFMEGNLTTGHRTSVVTGLPTVYWAMLNKHTPASKETTAQVDEQTAMLKAWSQVDADLARLGGNEGAVRMSKAKTFLEAMNQEMQSTVIYGSAASPEEFIGLSPRYSSLSAGNGDNIIDAGGTGSTDNTSIWLIEHGDETFAGITPKGSQTGLIHKDLGEVTSENSDGFLQVLRDYWSWAMGIALMDWRGVGRICNIDVSNLSSASDAADLLYFMADLEERMPVGTGKRAFYMNRTVRRFLRHQTTEAVGSGGGLTFENVGGKRVAFFGTSPVRTVDAILNTEDVVA
jgi:hypothetical protein